MITPNVSFIGHLSGIIVGLAYTMGPLKTVVDILESIAFPLLGQFNAICSKKFKFLVVILHMRMYCNRDVGYKFEKFQVLYRNHLRRQGIERGQIIEVGSLTGDLVVEMTVRMKALHTDGGMNRVNMLF